MFLQLILTIFQHVYTCLLYTSRQLDAVFEDITPDAVKIGMLSTPACMQAVSEKLLVYQPKNVVIDPVMTAKNGCPLMNAESVKPLLTEIVPLADVVTPNIPEAEIMKMCIRDRYYIQALNSSAWRSTQEAEEVPLLRV